MAKQTIEDLYKQYLLTDSETRVIGTRNYIQEVPKPFRRFYRADFLEDRESKVEEYYKAIESSYPSLVGENNNLFFEELRIKYTGFIEFVDLTARTNLKEEILSRGYEPVIKDLLQAYRETPKEFKKTVKNAILRQRKLTELNLGRIDFTKAKEDPKNDLRIYVEKENMNEGVIDSFKDTFTKDLDNKIYFDSDIALATKLLLDSGRLLQFAINEYKKTIKTVDQEQLEDQITIPGMEDFQKATQDNIQAYYTEIRTITTDFIEDVFKDVFKTLKKTASDSITEYLKRNQTVTTMLEPNVTELTTKQHEINENKTIVLKEHRVKGNEIILSEFKFPTQADKLLHLFFIKLNVLCNQNIKTVNIADEKNRTINITAKEFKEFVGGSNVTIANEQLESAFKSIENMIIKTSKSKGNILENEKFFYIFTGGEYDRVNGVTLVLNYDYAKYWQLTSKPNNTRLDTFKISNKKVLEYTLSKYLQRIFETNYKEGKVESLEDMQTISVESLLNALEDSIPSYKEIKENGGIKRSIVYPLIDTLNSLSVKKAKQEDYKFKTKDYKKGNKETIVKCEQGLIKEYWFIDPKGKEIRTNAKLEPLFNKKGFMKDFLKYKVALKLVFLEDNNIKQLPVKDTETTETE